MAYSSINNSHFNFNFTNIFNILTPTIITCYILSIAAILLNIFVLFILLKLKIVGDALSLLIMNLSISDLLKSSAIITYNIQAGTGANSTAMLGPTFDIWTTICKLNSFVLVSTSLSAIMTLGILAFERFRAIYYPLDNRSDHKQYFIAVVLIWILSLGASSYIFVSYHIIPYYPYICALNSDYFLGNNIWIIATGAICCIIPMLLACICYVMIGVKLCGRKSVIDSCMVHSEFLKKRRREMISVISLITITILATFSSCTFFLYIIIVLIEDSNRYFSFRANYIDINFHNIYIFQASIFLTVAQTSIDPILYNFVSSNFRKSVKQYLSSYLR